MQAKDSKEMYHAQAKGSGQLTWKTSIQTAGHKTALLFVGIRLILRRLSPQWRPNLGLRVQRRPEECTNLVEWKFVDRVREGDLVLDPHNPGHVAGRSTHIDLRPARTPAGAVLFLLQGQAGYLLQFRRDHLQFVADPSELFGGRAQGSVIRLLIRILPRLKNIIRNI